MELLLDLISRQVSDAFAEAGYDASYGKVTLSNRPDLCEYQCNGAMPAAKAYHKAPIQIAEEVAAKLNGNALFSQAEAVKPGFLNLRVSEEYLTGYLAQMAQDAHFGVTAEGAPRTVVLDYAFVNYRKRPGSVTTQAVTNSIRELARAFNSLFDFWFEHEEAPIGVKRLWASFWLSLFFWYFYQTQYDVRFPAEDRRKAFFEFFNRQGHRYREVARHAPRAKRLATPLLLLAWKTGWEFPVRCYFRYLYYPLIALKEKVSKK